MTTDFEIAILPNGDIRYYRCDLDTNEKVFAIVSKLNQSRLEEVRSFLEDSEEMENILGDDRLCG